MKLEDVTWIAGLLEGEGTFDTDGASRQIRIRCEMTDEDVINKLHVLSGGGAIHVSYRHTRNGNKTTWTWDIRGKLAYELELAILPYMGERRTAKILETHKLRREYESAATRSNIIRVFPA